MASQVPTSTAARNALVVVAVVLVGGAMRWMADILTPLLMAIFLAVMVDGLARVIRHRFPNTPGGVAMGAAILVSTALFAATVYVLADQAGSFVTDLAKAEPRLNALIMKVHRDFHLKGPRTLAQILTKLDPSRFVPSIAVAVQGFATSALFVLVYLGFLIASRRAMERKMVRLFRTREERHEALSVFLRIRDGIERYLWIQTVTGLMIAVASWMVMAVVGLENAVFWAFLIFIVNYVPILGATAGIILPPLFALVQFGGYAQAIIVLAGLWAITFVVGNVIYPRMQGDSLNVDPLVVLLSLAFWGALFGLTGAFLSTPLTVLAMVVLAQFPSTRWIAILLSADGDPERLGRGFEYSPDEAAAPLDTTQGVLSK